MNATYFVSVWVVVGVATLALAIYRHILTVHQEEDVVHLADGEHGAEHFFVPEAHALVDAVEQGGLNEIAVL